MRSFARCSSLPVCPSLYLTLGLDGGKKKKKNVQHTDKRQTMMTASKLDNHILYISRKYITKSFRVLYPVKQEKAQDRKDATKCAVLLISA